MHATCIALITFALLSSSVALLPVPAEDCPWSYNTLDVVYLGPSNWICNTTGFDTWTCLDGSNQSPIDLPLSVTTAEPAYTNNLARSSAKFAFSNNLQVNVTYVPGVSGGLGFNDTEELLVTNVIKGQKVPTDLVFEGFYVRSPAEHTVAGEAFNIEIQLVYSDPNATTINQWYFVSFLANEASEDSAGIASLAMALGGSPVRLLDVSYLTLVQLEVSGADIAKLNIGQGFWHYQGSIPFPPCAPANWFVSATPMAVSQATINLLLSSGFATPGDSRPIQPNYLRDLTFVDGTYSTDKGGNWKAAVGVSAGLLGLIFIILIIGAVAFRN